MSASDPVTPAARFGWLRAFLPHMITAAAAVAVTLMIVLALPRPVPEPLPIQTPLPQPTRQPEPTPVLQPTPAPQPTILSSEAAVIRQELLDQRAEDARIWTSIYLARAVSQAADAELALRDNDLERVGQLLIAIDESLTLAGRYADAAASDPILQLRRSTAELREDLYLRPEGMDMRLMRVRQGMLALIGERR